MTAHLLGWNASVGIVPRYDDHFSTDMVRGPFDENFGRLSHTMLRKLFKVITEKMLMETREKATS